MRRILIIQTQTHARLGTEMAEQQQELPDLNVARFDLTSSQPDYDNLLQAIFEADSVQVY